MTSGVYKLTFPSGRTYIGKSINIEERWKQHQDKFNKGTAAKNMQAEWDAYSQFSPEILFECHPDHIDIVESFYISRNRPELNSTRPSDPLDGINGDELDAFSKWLHRSTLEHTEILNELTNRLEVTLAVNDDLMAELDDANKRRTKEEIQTVVGKKLVAMTAEKDSLAYDIRVLEGNITDLKSKIKKLELPWWKRMFQ